MKERFKRCYFVELGNSWMVVRAHNKQEVKSSIVREYGRGHIRELRRATLNDVRRYLDQKGEDSIEDVSP